MIEVEYIDEDGNEKISERRDYQVMDKSNYLDEVFFVNDGVTAKGQEFIEYFKGFSGKVQSVLDSIRERDSRTVQSNYGFSSALSNLSLRFNYPDDDQFVNRDGIKEYWIYIMDFRIYEHQPGRSGAFYTINFISYDIFLFYVCIFNAYCPHCRFR